MCVPHSLPFFVRSLEITLPCQVIVRNEQPPPPFLRRSRRLGMLHGLGNDEGFQLLPRVLHHPAQRVVRVLHEEAHPVPVPLRGLHGVPPAELDLLRVDGGVGDVVDRVASREEEDGPAADADEQLAPAPAGGLALLVRVHRVGRLPLGGPIDGDGSAGRDGGIVPWWCIERKTR
jgi:hypothetical protein